MRHIKLLLALTMAMTVILVVSAAPLLASHNCIGVVRGGECLGVGHADWDDSNGWEHWDDWRGFGWADIDEVTDWDWDDGSLEIEAVGEFLGHPAEFELVCWDWWSCEITDVDRI